MNEFILPVQVRWADLDPNFHLRHSIYYDWGALCRIEFLYNNGLTPDAMTKLKMGPILFREESVFRKEIRFGDKVTIDLQLLKARKDLSRWTIRHRIMKNGNQVAAILTIEGAWMDTQLRKLATPTGEMAKAFEHMPKSEEFEWLG